MKTKIRNLIIVMVLFPMVYILLSITPLADELFIKGNNSYYLYFWPIVIVLHWLSFLIVKKLLKSENQALKDLGFGLNGKQTSILVIAYFLVAVTAFGFTEASLKFVKIDLDRLNQLPNYFPKTTAQRALFIFSVFTAGFCEEIIYRGYAITKLKELNINRWIAIFPAGISFVFIHGVAGFSQFWFYYIPAVVFGVLFILTRKLLPGMILHLLFNLSAIMAVFQAIEK